MSTAAVAERATTAIGAGAARRAPALLARSLLAVGSTWAGCAVLGATWRSGEAALVVAVLRMCGVHPLTRVGAQILVAPPSGGNSFLTAIEPWCSSLAIVLAFASAAAFVATGERRRRIGAFTIAAAIVVVCNVIRMVLTVLVGFRDGAGAIEPFHDGLATGFAVLFVLAALGVFVARLWPPPTTAAPPVEVATADIDTARVPTR